MGLDGVRFMGTHWNWTYEYPPHTFDKFTPLPIDYSHHKTLEYNLCKGH